MINSNKLEPLHMTTTIIPSNLRISLEYFKTKIVLCTPLHSFEVTSYFADYMLPYFVLTIQKKKKKKKTQIPMMRNWTLNLEPDNQPGQ